MTLPDKRTCKQKKSLTQNIIEVSFHTAAILMLLSSFQNIEWKDFGNLGIFSSFLPQNPAAKIVHLPEHHRAIL